MEEGCLPVTSWPPEEPNQEEEVEAVDEEVSPTNCPGQGKRARLSFDEPEARTSLAAWIRRSGIHSSIPVDIKARSKLNFAATTNHGKRFLREKLSELKERRGMFECSANYFYVLATYFDLLAQNTQAIEFCKESLALSTTNSQLLSSTSAKEFLGLIEDLDEEVRERLWLLAKLEEEHRIKKMKNNKQSPAKVLTIDRINASQLSVEKFKSEYCEKRRALILTGLSSPTPTTWDLKHIRDVCGERLVSVKAPSNHSSEWAKLEEVESKKLADFLDQKVSDHYLFDWSLPLNAPELAAEFRVPSYFSENILERSSEGALYRSSWPSLFIGPRGTRSALHIDAIGSHFWMYLISGTKRWTFYPADRTGDLNPVYFDSLDPVFWPDEEELKKIDHFTIDLKPGELLFVPAGFPHKVENLEDTIAVSGNFVNTTNVKEFTKHLKVNGLLDPRSMDLLKELVELELVT